MDQCDYQYDPLERTFAVRSFPGGKWAKKLAIDEQGKLSPAFHYDETWLNPDFNGRKYLKSVRILQDRDMQLSLGHAVIDKLVIPTSIQVDADKLYWA